MTRERSKPRPPQREETRARDIEVQFPRCPYCHEDVAPQGEKAYGCPSCLAWHHRACWDELAGCGVCRERAGEPSPGSVKARLRLMVRLSAIYVVMGLVLGFLGMWPLVGLLALVGVGSAFTFWRSAMRILDGERPPAPGETFADAERIRRRMTRVYLILVPPCLLAGLLVHFGVIPTDPANTLGFTAMGITSGLVLLACGIYMRRAGRRSSAHVATKAKGQGD